MRRIPLRRRDGTVVGYALVDAARYAALSRFTWCLSAHGYVVRGARGRQVSMHRVILGLEPGDGLEGDHRDGNRLDNRDGNLRVTTHAQGMQNRRQHRNNHSGYRGVYWNKQAGRWQAEGRLDGRKYYLGRYDDPAEAGRVAAAWRAEHMPYTTT